MVVNPGETITVGNRTLTAVIRKMAPTMILSQMLKTMTEVPG